MTSLPQSLSTLGYHFFRLFNISFRAHGKDLGNLLRSLSKRESDLFAKFEERAPAVWYARLGFSWWLVSSLWQNSTMWAGNMLAAFSCLQGLKSPSYYHEESSPACDTMSSSIKLSSGWFPRPVLPGRLRCHAGLGQCPSLVPPRYRAIADIFPIFLP